jgi:hypothetical protein
LQDFVEVETGGLLTLWVLLERQQKLTPIVLSREQQKDVVHVPVVVYF